MAEVFGDRRSEEGLNACRDGCDEGGPFPNRIRDGRLKLVARFVKAVAQFGEFASDGFVRFPGDDGEVFGCGLQVLRDSLEAEPSGRGSR